MSQQVMDEIIKCAGSTYPKEAVGLLGGTRNTIKSVYPLRNLATGLEFFADPFDQYQAVRKIELGRERLIATFHTHPEGGAQLSASRPQICVRGGPSRHRDWIERRRP